MEALQVQDVILAAESARANGAVFLAGELLQLAEQMLPAVDHEATALSRLAMEAIEARMPLGLRAGDELRHSMLEGSSR